MTPFLAVVLAALCLAETVICETETKPKLVVKSSPRCAGADTTTPAPTLTEVAKGKPAKQSTTYGSSYGPEKAVDGNAGNFQHNAEYEKFPWWRVDLGKPYLITKVDIKYRGAYERRFHDGRIVISDTDIANEPAHTVFNPGPSSICKDKIGSDAPVGGGFQTFICDKPVMGQYVSIQITANCSYENCNNPADRGNPNKYSQMLHMSEVKVYSETAVPRPMAVVLTGAQVLQSSTVYITQDAGKAIDGDTNTMQHTVSCDDFPYWRADLNASTEILSVSVFARPDYEQRFHNVRIAVSDEDIMTKPPHSEFNPGPNAVCEENIGSEKAVTPGWTTFTCKKPVTGKYVSLQITAECKAGRTDCNRPNDKSKMTLNMMEVEICVMAVP